MGDREQRIRERAYDLWQKAGEPHGQHDEHWAQAELDLGRESEGADASASDVDEDGAVGGSGTSGLEAGIDGLTAPDTNSSGSLAGEAEIGLATQADAASVPPTAQAATAPTPKPRARRGTAKKG
jgi:hypothetical protein